MDRQQLMKIALLALAVLALGYVMSLYSKKQEVNHSGLVDTFTDGEDDQELFEDKPEDDDKKEDDDEDDEEKEEFTNHESSGVQASEPTGQNEVYHQLNSNTDSGKFGLSGNQYPKDCFLKINYPPVNYCQVMLIQNGLNQSQQAKAIRRSKLLNCGYHVGVNTVGQTLRNANRQLRSEPPNPQVKVSPWLQTTIEADANRRPLEGRRL